MKDKYDDELPLEARIDECSGLPMNEIEEKERAEKLYLNREQAKNWYKKADEIAYGTDTDFVEKKVALLDDSKLKQLEKEKGDWHSLVHRAFMKKYDSIKNEYNF